MYFDSTIYFRKDYIYMLLKAFSLHVCQKKMVWGFARQHPLQSVVSSPWFQLNMIEMLKLCVLRMDWWRGSRFEMTKDAFAETPAQCWTLCCSCDSLLQGSTLDIWAETGDQEPIFSQWDWCPGIPKMFSVVWTNHGIFSVLIPIFKFQLQERRCLYAAMDRRFQQGGLPVALLACETSSPLQLQDSLFFWKLWNSKKYMIFSFLDATCLTSDLKPDLLEKYAQASGNHSKKLGTQLWLLAFQWTSPN